MRVTVLETYRYATRRDGFYQIHAQGCSCRHVTGRKVVFSGRVSDLDRLAVRLIRDMLNEDYGYRHYRFSDLAPDDCWPDLMLAACMC